VAFSKAPGRRRVRIVIRKLLKGTTVLGSEMFILNAWIFGICNKANHMLLVKLCVLYSSHVEFLMPNTLEGDDIWR
jgi:hypothetical protein